MLCPNCKSPMKMVTVEGIEVEHCLQCGGTFFDDNDINRISLSTAQKLSLSEVSESLSSEPKLCPNDATPLTAINRDTIPQYVTLLGCLKCHGIFAYPHDLVDFKKAQKENPALANTLNFSLTPLRNAAVSAVFILISITTIGLTYFMTNHSQLINSNAGEICQPLEVVRTDTGRILFCQTQSPYTSRIIETCSGTDTVVDISQKPATRHFITIPLSCSIGRLIFNQDKIQIETPLINLTAYE